MTKSQYQQEREAELYGEPNPYVRELLEKDIAEARTILVEMNAQEQHS